jgi:hypothetical protein
MHARAIALKQMFADPPAASRPSRPAPFCASLPVMVQCRGEGRSDAALPVAGAALRGGAGK